MGKKLSFYTMTEILPIIPLTLFVLIHVETHSEGVFMGWRPTIHHAVDSQ